MLPRKSREFPYDGNPGILRFFLKIHVPVGRRRVRLPSGETLAQIAARTGLAYSTVWERYRAGWPEELLGTPADRGEVRANRPTVP
jgi:hypothetical protein